jgi:hypothetical protein
MKVLKLDARFEDARKIANTLIGSITTKPNDPFGDYGVLVYAENVRESFLLDEGINLKLDDTIYLHIEELKFCPFMALREGVFVSSIEAWDDTTDYSLGMIFGIFDDRFYGTHPRYGDWQMAEIVLDLGPIERGELQGCEIVEVE